MRVFGLKPNVRKIITEMDLLNGIEYLIKNKNRDDDYIPYGMYV